MNPRRLLTLLVSFSLLVQSLSVFLLSTLHGGLPA